MDYILTDCCCLGFAVGLAKLSDIYGRRTLLIVSWILFTAFSIGCGCSKTMLQQ